LIRATASLVNETRRDGSSSNLTRQLHLRTAAQTLLVIFLHAAVPLFGEIQRCLLRAGEGYLLSLSIQIGANRNCCGEIPCDETYATLPRASFWHVTCGVSGVNRMNNSEVEDYYETD